MQEVIVEQRNSHHHDQPNQQDDLRYSISCQQHGEQFCAPSIWYFQVY